MKKFIPILLLLTSITVFAQTEPTDTDSDGYRNVSTLDHLLWISLNSSRWADNYELDNDIDASATSTWNGGLGFIPIGNSITKFTGKFDGHGKKITSLHINRNINFVGFFGYISGTDAEVSNLTISEAKIEGRNNVGGIAGGISDASIVECHTSGIIIANERVGGIVGDAYLGKKNKLYRSSSATNITGTEEVGGIAGRYYGTMLRCFNVGTITSVNGERVGGLVGNIESAYVKNCYAAGIMNLTNPKYSGGLIGTNHHGTVVNSFWDRNVTGQNQSDGGTRLTTPKMKSKDTYTDFFWNFDGWWDINPTQNNGYPYFNDRRIERTGTEPTDTDGNGYLNISSFDHLLWVSENPSSWSSNFELDNDIDASNSKRLMGLTGFNPIGNNATKFTGKFDGKGYTISNLWYYDEVKDNVGFFGYMNGENSEVLNLTLSDLTIIARGNVGGIAGKIQNSLINSCHTSGIIVAEQGVGGIVGDGYSSKTRVYRSSSATNVKGRERIGGIAGRCYGTMLRCFSVGTITSVNGERVGGLVGNIESANIKNCYAAGIMDITNSSYTGGLIGINRFGTVVNSFWDKDVTGQDQSDGGTSLSTPEMKAEATYEGAEWDLKYRWKLVPTENNGYPIPKGGIIEAHEIPLASGWNTISSYLVPEDENMASAVKSVSDELLVIRTLGVSDIYFPNQGILGLNKWEMTRAYDIYMKQPATLKFLGYKLPDIPEIDLKVGWNSLPFLKSQTMSTSTALSDIMTSLLLVRGKSGSIYFPMLNINNLDKLNPGKGYSIYMTSPATLTYP